MESIMRKVFDCRAASRQGLRQAVIAQLYATRSNPYTGSNNPREKQIQVLNDLASSFSRFAGNQQTAFDNGASRSATVIDSSGMERQIARAFNQVLGRAPGRGVDSFMSALNGAFPLTATSEGQQVTFTPARSVVSVYAAGNSSQNGYSDGGSAGGSIGSSLAGQLPARQAALYRQVSILVSDALGVLAGLQPFVAEANSEQVEALRLQIQTEFIAHRDEVGRIDEPRPERVRAYFDSLTLHITEFGRRAFLNRRDLIATSTDEAQIAGFELLKNYTSTLRDIWDRFYNDDRSATAVPSLSERVERANILLPVIAQGVNDFEAAMDSVDFTESDRHSSATKFSGLIDPPNLMIKKLTIQGQAPSVKPPLSLQLTQPDMTVYDLTEWLDRFSTIEGPTSLADSGQYGLDFVADQADTLFWTVVPIVTHIKVTAPSLLGRTTLDQVLSNERVGWALDNILTQLNALAELAAPPKKRNPRVL